MAELLGQPFMPWQRYIADVAGEYDPTTGIPYYREAFDSVSRQQGKTILKVAWQVDRCLNWGRHFPDGLLRLQRSAFTAQTGKDARDKWIDEIFPMIRTSRIMPLVKQINEGMGNEVIRFKTGSLIRLLSSSTSSGHSKTLHQAVLDEIWHDEDDRREQGLRPAMITVPDAQLLVCSTAGTQASSVYNRKVKIGRKAVVEDRGSGVAYFECSAPDDWDPDDEESYFGFMPALCPDPPCRCSSYWKHTITMDAIRAEREALEAGEFLRAYGNRPTVSTDLVIPADAWALVCKDTAKPSGRLRFALDVSEDRSWAAIAVASSDRVIEIVEHRPGTGWVVERCNELTKAHGGAIALDKGGPAGVFADDIDKCEELQGREVLQACGAFYDAVIDAEVTIRTDPALDEALAGAVKKETGDMWRWSRKASVTDVTPLMAATLAFGAPERSIRPLVATT